VCVLCVMCVLCATVVRKVMNKNESLIIVGPERSTLCHEKTNKQKKTKRKKKNDEGEGLNTAIS